MEKGTRGRMSAAFKERFVKNRHNIAHIREFGECVGIVQGLTDFGKQKGPEVDVRWQPSNLRYAYLPEELEVVR